MASWPVLQPSHAKLASSPRGGASPRPLAGGGAQGPRALPMLKINKLVHLRARHDTLARISPMVRGRSSKMLL